MRHALTALCAAFLAASCTIMPEPVPVNVIFMGKTPVHVKGGMDDDSIGHLDLLVFRTRDGMLLDKCCRDGNLPMEARLPSGEQCRWYIVANAEGRFDGCTFLEEFLETEIALTDGPVMHSEGLSVFWESGTTVQAELRRFACKVGLGSICMNWSDALPCTVKTVALTNVLETTSPDQTSTHNTLVNCGVVSEDLDGLIASYPELELDTQVPVEIGTTLFCMPSGSTRLALCISAPDGLNWYPIELPQMEENHFYLVDNVVINGPGAPGPDMPVERIPASFDVSIKPWEENNVPIQL